MYHLSKLVTPASYKSQDVRKAHLSRTQPVITLPGDLGTNSFADENSELVSNMQSIMIVNEVDTDQVHFKTEGDMSDDTEPNPFTVLSMSFYERKSPDVTVDKRQKKDGNVGNEMAFQHFRPSLKMRLCSPAKKAMANNQESGANSTNTMMTSQCSHRGNDKTELFSIAEQDMKKKFQSPQPTQSKMQKEIKKVLRPALEEKPKPYINIVSKEKSATRKNTEPTNLSHSNKTDVKQAQTQIQTQTQGQAQVQAQAHNQGQQQVGKKDTEAKLAVKRSPIMVTKMAKTPRMKENIVKKGITGKINQENHVSLSNKANPLSDTRRMRTAPTQTKEKKDTGITSKRSLNMQYKLPMHRLHIDLSGVTSGKKSPTVNSFRLGTETNPVSEPFRSERHERSGLSGGDRLVRKNIIAEKENFCKGSPVNNRRFTLDDDRHKKPAANKFNDYNFDEQENRFHQHQIPQSARGDSFGEKGLGLGWQSYFKASLSNVLEPSDRQNREGHDMSGQSLKGSYTARVSGTLNTPR